MLSTKEVVIDDDQMWMVCTCDLWYAGVFAFNYVVSAKIILKNLIQVDNKKK